MSFQRPRPRRKRGVSMTGNRRDLEKRLEELHERDADETPDNLADLILEEYGGNADDE